MSAILELTRACTRCGAVKRLSEFRQSKEGKHGKQAVCRPCDSERNREYRENPEAKARRRVGRRQYMRAHPEKQMLWSARERAKKNGLECTITEADILIPLVCPVFGTPLADGTRGFSDNSPSLDRIDPRLGYVPGNVVVVSWRANALKRDATISELERLLTWMRSVGAP